MEITTLFIKITYQFLNLSHKSSIHDCFHFGNSRTFKEMNGYFGAAHGFVLSVTLKILLFFLQVQIYYFSCKQATIFVLLLTKSSILKK